MTRSTTARAVLAAVAGVMALGAAATATAQPYGYNGSAYSGGYNNNYSYDPCRRDQTNRGTTGALAGAALGAVIGSNAAARNARTEGALLGGVLGAVVGGNVGKSSAACRSQYQQPGSSAYYGADGYQTYGSNGYDNRYQGYQGYQGAYQPSYQGGYAGAGYDDRGGYDAYPVAGGQVDASGCSLAESPIYLPDGRVQKRFVRVCQDASGRYQVVD